VFKVPSKAARTAGPRAGGGGLHGNLTLRGGKTHPVTMKRTHGKEGLGNNGRGPTVKQKRIRDQASRKNAGVRAKATKVN